MVYIEHWTLSFKRKLAIRLLFQFTYVSVRIFYIPIFMYLKWIKTTEIPFDATKSLQLLEILLRFSESVMYDYYFHIFQIWLCCFLCGSHVLYLYRILYLNGMCFSDDIRLEYSVVYFVFCGIHVKTIRNGNGNTMYLCAKMKILCQQCIVPLTTFQLFTAKQCEYSGIKELPSLMYVWMCGKYNRSGVAYALPAQTIQ